MKHIKQRGIILSLLIAFTVSFMPHNKVMATEIQIAEETQAIALSKNTEGENLEKNNSIRSQDDFYEYVNGEWLKTAYHNINPLFRENSYISDLYEKSDKDVRDMFNDLLDNSSQYDENSDEKKW